MSRPYESGVTRTSTAGYSGFPAYSRIYRQRGSSTVSRRSKPSSRTALMGEQPNPWDLLQPQDATSRHRGAKPCRRCDALQLLAVQTIPSSPFGFGDGGVLWKPQIWPAPPAMTSISRAHARSRYGGSLSSRPATFPRYCPPTECHGFHRYEPLCTARSLERGATIDSWARSACYPRGSFYPLSDGLSIQSRRITMPDFRPCSACQPHSQAPLRHYTPKPDFHPG